MCETSRYHIAMKNIKYNVFKRLEFEPYPNINDEV